MAVIIELAMYRLLQYSDIFDEKSDARIHKLFKQDRKTGLSYEDVEAMGFGKDDIQFINENKDTWINLARKQWKHVKTRKREKKEHCELCNTKHNLMCFVKNKKNGKLLNIGGTCVETFGDDISKEHSSLIKNASEMHNFEKIQKTIPTIRSTSEKWNDFLKQTPLIVPVSLSGKYRSIGREINDTFKKAIKTSNNSQLIKKLGTLLGKGGRVKGQINSYCRKYETEKYILSRELYEDMLRNQSSECNRIVELASKESVVKITYQIAHRVRSEIFLKQAMADLNILLRNFQIITLKNGMFYLSFRKHKDILFNVDTSDFLKIFGELLFNNSENFSEHSAIQELIEYLNFDVNKSMLDVYSVIDNKLQDGTFKYTRYNPQSDYQLNGIIRDDIKKTEIKQNTRQELEIVKEKIINSWEKTQSANDYLDLFYDRIMFLSGDTLTNSLISVFSRDHISFRINLFLKYQNFTSELDKLVELYSKLNQNDISNSIKRLNQSKNVGNVIEKRYEVERLLEYKVYLTDAEIGVKLESLKDQIVDYQRYKHDYVDYVNEQEKDKVIRVKKSDFLNIGKYLVLSKKSVYKTKALNMIKSAKKIDKNNYRKEAMISIEAQKMTF